MRPNLNKHMDDPANKHMDDPANKHMDETANKHMVFKTETKWIFMRQSGYLLDWSSQTLPTLTLTVRSQIGQLTLTPQLV
jgi:hypothetical protein